MSGGANPFGKLFGGGAKGGLFGGTAAPTVADHTKTKWGQGPDVTTQISPHRGLAGARQEFRGQGVQRTTPKLTKTYDELGHAKAKEQWKFKEDMRQRKLAKMKELMDYGAKDLNQKMTSRRPGATPEARSLVDSPMMPANPAVDIMDPEIKSARGRDRKRYGRRYG